MMHRLNAWFADIATIAGKWSGASITAIVAFLLVVVWALTGPFFNYSDTWQLVINTSTTVITYLLLFLVQNTQLRSDEAVQTKLDALIVSLRETDSRLAGIERMTLEEVEQVHEQVLEESTADAEAG